MTVVVRYQVDGGGFNRSPPHTQHTPDDWLYLGSLKSESSLGGLESESNHRGQCNIRNHPRTEAQVNRFFNLTPHTPCQSTSWSCVWYLYRSDVLLLLTTPDYFHSFSAVECRNRNVKFITFFHIKLFECARAPPSSI